MSGLQYDVDEDDDVDDDDDVEKRDQRYVIVFSHSLVIMASSLRQAQKKLNSHPHLFVRVNAALMTDSRHP